MPQNALSTAAEVVAPANTGRIFLEVRNMDATITVYVGDSTVSTANGHPLKANEAFGWERYTGEVWAVAASGTPSVSVIEW